MTGKKWQGPGVFVSEIDDGYYTHAVRALVVIIYFAPAGYTPFIPTYSSRVIFVIEMIECRNLVRSKTPTHAVKWRRAK